MPADLIVAGIVGVTLFYVAYAILKFIADNIGMILANIFGTALIVGGVIMGFGLLVGEASAAMAIAVPASLTVAKMRASTGGF